MIEFFRHIFGLCGEHFHPNVFTMMVSSPLIIATIHWIKCKCGGMFFHQKDCKNNLDNSI